MSGTTHISYQFRPWKFYKKSRNRMTNGYFGGPYKTFFPGTVHISNAKDVRMIEDIPAEKVEDTIDLEKPV